MLNTLVGGYTIYQLLCYFLLYSFLGWCIEVAFCSIRTGKFVNRGFLNGPLCPIYGFGASIVVVLLRPVQDNLLLLFLASVVVTSVLELVTGFALEKIFHTRWWDYSSQPLNLGGYICLGFSLAWGLACLLLVRFIHPAVTALVNWVPGGLGRALLLAAYLLLLADFIVTVAAVRKLNRDLGELTSIAAAIHRGSDKMAAGLGNTAIAVAGEIGKLDIPEKSKKIAEKWLEGREAAQARREELLAKRFPIRRRLLKAFPTMRHTKYPDALRELAARLRGKNGPKNEAQDETIPGTEATDRQTEE